jgi:tetratricopeptide (TPR) repeat protein
MPRSVSIHPDRKQTVEDALKRNGFLTQGDFAVNIEIALSTVSKFFNGKSVYISKFELICEALGLDKQEIQRPLESSQDKAVKETLEIIPTLYNPEKWVGRSQLIEMLLNQFQQNTRIVWLTGLSGIGKTTLGECIAVKDWESDPSFQWLHIEISASQLPDFATGAREILSQLGEKELDPQEMNDPKRLSDRLLKKLQSSFYWFQIDAIEKLIEANEFIDSYWLTFLESCLNTNHFSSRLLLTSQVLPNSLINWCDRFSNIWHQETLKGLANDESEQYFAKNGIVISEFNQDILNRIGQTYEGHPLVLQVITGEILQVYQGDVTAYWQVNQTEFEQVSRELKSSRLTETDYNEQLARRVRERVKKSLEQLPEKAITLLCRSAVYRRPVLKKFWLGLITEYSPKEQLEAYRVLGDRALIETERNLIRLHNLVRDIAYDWLREDESIWKAAEVKAAELWLNKYPMTGNGDNFEKVQAYVDAAYHYYAVKDYQKIRSMVIGDGWGILIQLWGYSKEIILIYSFLINKVSEETDLICFKALGNATHELGDYEIAKNWYHKSLDIALKINDKFEQGEILNNIANCWKNTRNYDQAIKIYFHSLEIARKQKKQSLIARVLGNIGNIYNENGNHILAIKFYRQSLVILEKLISKEPIAIHQYSIEMGNLGNAYYWSGDYKNAMEYQLIHLDMSRKLGDKQGENRSLGRLGRIHHSMGNNSKAIKHLHESLSISQDIGDRKSEKEAWGELTNIFISEENYLQALRCSQSRLNIISEMGDLLNEAENLLQIGSIYEIMKNYERAEENYLLAQNIFHIKEIYEGQILSLFNLGRTQFNKGKYENAINYYQKCLAISKNIKWHLYELTTLGLLGLSNQHLGNINKAEEFFLEYLYFAQKTNDYIGQSGGHSNLARLYTSVSNYQKAIFHLSCQLNIAKNQKDKSGEMSAISGLALVNKKAGNFLEALNFLFLLLQYNNENSEKKAIILLEISEIYYSTKKPKFARQNCEQALQIATELGIPLAQECQELLSKIEEEAMNAQEN